MAAVLACGTGAVLSHESAAQLWGFRPPVKGPVTISVPSGRHPRRQGIRIHRRQEIEATKRHGIPVTSPTRTVLDLAPGLTERQLERLINEADKLDLTHPDELRTVAIAERSRGAKLVRTLLDEATFVLTDSDLERRFVRIARDAGLPKPETQVTVCGHRVDFLFREAGVVIETDGLRYHRTPTQQKRDRVRDQELTVAGMRILRFTHGQIRFERAYVAEVLRRLSSEG